MKTYYIILFLISFIGWLILYLIYKQLEPNDDDAYSFKILHLILILLSTFIPCLNVAIFLIFGTVTCALLHSEYHFKKSYNQSRLFQFLNKKI